MKKSISYWTLGGFDGAVPVVEAARLAHEMGYDAIELCYGEGELVPEATAETLADIRAALEEIGIGITSLCSGNYWIKSLSSEDEVEREAAIAFSEAYIACAAALGTDTVLILPGTVYVPWNPARPVVPAKRAWELAQDSIKRLIPVAERHGITIALENVWAKFLTGPFEFAAFVDSFDSPWVKCYFDVGNVGACGYPEHWIEILGKRITRVHAKGFRERPEGGGTMNDFTESLFDSTINWPAVMGALRAAGYDGYVTMELIVSSKGLPDNDLGWKGAKELDLVLAM